MEPESGFIFKNISSSENLNSQTKFEFAFKIFILNSYEEEFKKKLYFNNSVTIKSTFLAN